MRWGINWRYFLWTKQCSIYKKINLKTFTGQGCHVHKNFNKYLIAVRILTLWVEKLGDFFWPIIIFTVMILLSVLYLTLYYQSLWNIPMHLYSKAFFYRALMLLRSPKDGPCNTAATLLKLVASWTSGAGQSGMVVCPYFVIYKI